MGDGEKPFPDSLLAAYDNAKNQLRTIYGQTRTIYTGQEAIAVPSPDDLLDSYANDTIIQTIAGSFAKSSKSISDMRSSYLPQEYWPSIHKKSGSNASREGILTQTGVEQTDVTVYTAARPSDEFTQLESYENAFFRMLGMPSTADARLVSAGGRSNEFIAIDPHTPRQGTPGSKTSKLIQGDDGGWEPMLDAGGGIKIFQERQKTSKMRAIRISDELFRLSESGWESALEEKDSAKVIEDFNSWANLPVTDTVMRARYDDRYTNPGNLGVSMAQRKLWSIFVHGSGGDFDSLFNDFTKAPEGSRQKALHTWLKTHAEEVSLKGLHRHFWKLKYLMFPPIQDGSISSCINEPGKIVPPPFSGYEKTTISGKTPRISLLEAVARIRFDRASGMSSKEQMLHSNEEGIQELDEIFHPDSNEYGALEAMLIVRLTVAIRSYAQNVKEYTEEIIRYLDNLSKDMKVWTDSNIPKDHEASSQPTEDIATDEDIKNLEARITMDTAILTLFGNTSAVPGLSSLLGTSGENVLDLQWNNVRTSATVNAHLIAPALNIVSLPLEAANSELKRLKKEKTNRAASSILPKVAEIKTIMGISNGIGALDIAVFVLALFTVKEEYLVHLLPNDLIKNVKNSKDTASLGFDRGWLLSAVKFHSVTADDADAVVKAVNAVSALAMQGYGLFQDELSAQATRNNIKRRRTAPAEEVKK